MLLGFAVMLVKANAAYVSKRHVWVHGIVFTVLIAVTAFFSLPFQQSDTGKRDVFVFMSTMDDDAFRNLPLALERMSEHGSPSFRAFVSPKALGHANRLNLNMTVPYDEITPLGGEFGLTLEDIIDEIASIRASKDIPYIYVVQPRSSSPSSAIASIDELRGGTGTDIARGLLHDRLRFVSVRSGHSLISIGIDAPEYVDPRAQPFKVSFAFASDETVVGGSAGLKLDLFTIGHDGVLQSFAIDDNGALEPSAAGTSIPLSQARFTTSGVFDTPSINETITTVLRVSNDHNETIAEVQKFTQALPVKLSVVAVQRDGETVQGQFKDFARISGIDTRTVELSLNEQSESLAEKLDDLGLLLVDLALSKSEGDALVAALNVTKNPPALLFVGAGGAVIHSKLDNEAIAGWHPFLSPLGIEGFASSRKVALVSDKSGSLEGYADVVGASARVAHKALGERDGNILSYLCRCNRVACYEPRDRRQCSSSSFASELSGDFSGTDWEAAHHFVQLQKNWKIPNSDAEWLTDVLMFEDGSDVKRIPPFYSLSKDAKLARQEMKQAGVEFHIVTFGGRAPDRTDSLHADVRMHMSNTSTAQIENFKSMVLGPLLPRMMLQDSRTEYCKPDGNSIRAARNVNLTGGLVSSLLRDTEELRDGSEYLLCGVHPANRHVFPLFVQSSSVTVGSKNVRVGYLGIDLAAEFGSSDYSGSARRNAVAGVIFAAVEQFAFEVPPKDVVVWRVDSLLRASKPDYSAFVLGRPISAQAQLVDSDCSPTHSANGCDSAVIDLRWDGESLLSMGASLASLAENKVYRISAELCQFGGLSQRVEAGIEHASKCRSSMRAFSILGPVPTVIGARLLASSGRTFEWDSLGNALLDTSTNNSASTSELDPTEADVAEFPVLVIQFLVTCFFGMFLWACSRL